jgi:hypothetical protein
MEWSDHTAICTYRVREGARDAFLELLRQHWPTLHGQGLVNETPALIFEGTAGGGPHGDSGTTFLEIFSWKNAASADRAHELPVVMAIWERMGAFLEARDGRPAVEFPHFRPLESVAA